MNKTQTKLLGLMRAGHKLWWFGDNGPELTGHPFWPHKRTVRQLIAAGVLRWRAPLNQTQAACGIGELEEAKP